MSKNAAFLQRLHLRLVCVLRSKIRVFRVREKRGLLEKGSFQKSPFSRDSRDFRDSRVFRESPDLRRIRPSSRDSRELRGFRDSRDSSSEKTPFGMTPFSGPEF